MKNKGQRPVYLNLFKIRLPIGGVVSIVHRVSGVVLVLLLPAYIYLLDLALENRAGFAKVGAIISSTPGKVIVLITLWFLAQHLSSGVRHLLLDLDIGVGRANARTSAWVTFAISTMTALVAAVYGW